MLRTHDGTFRRLWRLPPQASILPVFGDRRCLHLQVLPPPSPSVRCKTSQNGLQGPIHAAHGTGCGREPLRVGNQDETHDSPSKGSISVWVLMASLGSFLISRTSELSSNFSCGVATLQGIKSKPDRHPLARLSGLSRLVSFCVHVWLPPHLIPLQQARKAAQNSSSYSGPIYRSFQAFSQFSCPKTFGPWASHSRLSQMT